MKIVIPDSLIAVLNSVGVIVLEKSKLILQCQTCKNIWEVFPGVGGWTRFGWWYCRKGCNLNTVKK